MCHRPGQLLPSAVRGENGTVGHFYLMLCFNLTPLLGNYSSKIQINVTLMRTLSSNSKEWFGF